MRYLTIFVALSALPLMLLGTSPRASASPSFEEAECPVEVPGEHLDRVRCGVLTVPERRDGESVRTIRLPVAIIASHSATPAPDPLVFPTAGGPGAGSFRWLEHFLDWADWAADERDIILVEQRGDLAADPSLDCIEMDAEHQVFDDPAAGVPEASEPDFSQLRECRERLIAQGIDLAAYSTSESAADLADLRQSLGYDQWNLYGTS